MTSLTASVMKWQALQIRVEWWTEYTFTLEGFDAPVLFVRWRSISWMDRALARPKNAWTAGANGYTWWFSVQLVSGEKWCTLRVEFWVQYCSVLFSISTKSLVAETDRKTVSSARLQKTLNWGSDTDRRSKVQYGGTLRNLRSWPSEALWVKQEILQMFCRWGEIAPCSIQSGRGLARDQMCWKGLEVSSGCQVEPKLCSHCK